MHIKCVSITIVNNFLHILCIFSLIFKTIQTQQKENIPEFETYPIFDSDKSDEDITQTAWIQRRTSSSSINVENVDYDKVLPKYSVDEVADHVINSGVIEKLETEELEKFYKKYHEFNDNNESNDNNNEYENEELRHRNDRQRHRMMRRKQLLKHLLEIYNLKSSGILAKRGEGPQLSIVNPLDVLRQRLLLELARRRMKENQDQIQANAEILRKIGKRSVAFGTIPQQTVIHSEQAFKKFINNTIDRRSHRFLDSNITQKSLNNNTNNNLNYNIKCQRNRRKSGANTRLFLDKMKKIV